MTPVSGDGPAVPGLSPETSLDLCLRAAGRFFATQGLDEADSDARLLLEAATGLGRTGLIRTGGEPVGAEALRRFQTYAHRRLAREPVTRILGRRGFWTLDLLVHPDVLDPRADTETLVASAVALLGPRRGEALRVADLGTGSGALLCALLAEFPRATGLGVDRAPAACRAATANLVHCGLGERGTVAQGDFRVAASRGRFDLVVSNPPYIPRDTIAHLDPEVRDHDPTGALDGGSDGLDAYRALAPLLPELLADRGLAIVEIGWGQAEAVASLFATTGLALVEQRHDLAGIARALAFVVNPDVTGP